MAAAFIAVGDLQQDVGTWADLSLLALTPLLGPQLDLGQLKPH
jgi:hypothetical protein